MNDSTYSQLRTSPRKIKWPTANVTVLECNTGSINLLKWKLRKYFTADVTWFAVLKCESRNRTSPCLEQCNRLLNKWMTHPTGSGPPHNGVFMITLRHTTLGRTPLAELPARRRELYLTKHTNTHTNMRQTSMSPAGF